MKRLFISLITFAIVLTGLNADAADLERADFLYDESLSEEGLALMLKILPDADSDREKAEIYWRLSQFTLGVTDNLEEQGASKEELLEGFTKGTDYATLAIELNNSSHLGYYWRSANIGRWGQTKGILNSLFKASSMRDDLIKAITIKPDHGDSWYVLGRLYSEVPGIISFGNGTFAVSMDRKAIDNQEGPDKNFSYYIEFAKHLHNRNWNTSKRNRETPKMKRNFDRKTVFFEKHWFYEGTVDFTKTPEYSNSALKDLSDREEALDVLNWLKNMLEAIRGKTSGEEEDLIEVKELLAEYN